MIFEKKVINLGVLVFFEYFLVFLIKFCMLLDFKIIWFKMFKKIKNLKI